MKAIHPFDIVAKRRQIAKELRIAKWHLRRAAEARKDAVDQLKDFMPKQTKEALKHKRH